MYQLSILLPSAHESKRSKFIASLYETVSDWSQIELVICLDADDDNEDGKTMRHGNYVYTFAAPSKYRGRFFDAAWKASTGRFLLMANDDILFKTKGWDKLIPYDKYPDDLVVFGFRDNQFNERFFCHPVWSRKAMEMGDNLFGPNYWITKCDNTVFDIHPPNRRIYLPEIELEHKQTPYGKEWQPAYDHDNNIYMQNHHVRLAAAKKINAELGLDKYRVMMGITTAEYARRADFYDWINLIQKPANTIQVMMHGQSIAYNRNQIVNQALIHDCSHVLFIDDDVLCKPNIMYQLLEHKKEIVCALQLRRNYPHEALVYDMNKRPLHLTPDFGGLVEIGGAGLGSCLIQTEVFKRMVEDEDLPFFRMGQIKMVDMIGEDTNFFDRALGLGFKAYCDTDARVGHIGSVSLWPDKVGGKWVTTYDTQGTGRISVPAPVIAPVIETMVEA